jgi:hypothetical protein
MNGAAVSYIVPEREGESAAAETATRGFASVEEF